MLNEEQKLEYQKLREEYALLANTISTTVTFSVAGCVAIFGYILETTSKSIFLFGLPLLIIYPACLIIISRLQSVIRIAAYIYVFFEQNSDLKYETRYLSFKTKSKLKLAFSQTIFLIYIGLLVINILIFTLNDFNSYRDYLIYGVSLSLIAIIFHFIRMDWRAKFIKYWEEVRDEERNLK